MGSQQLRLKAIGEALRAKGVTLARTGCGQNAGRALVDEVFYLTFTDPKQPLIPGNASPSILLICNDCGHTEIHNIHALGIASILGVPPPGAPLT